jgi:sensor histidine kinase YesM
MTYIKLRKKGYFLNRVGKFILLNLGIAFILMVIFCPECFTSLDYMIEIIPDFIFSFLMSSTLSFGGFLVESYFDSKISWIRFPVKRLLLTALVYSAYSFIASYILSSAYALIIIEEVNWQTINWIKMMDHTRTPVTIALIIITIFTARSWLYEWRNAAIETEKLRTEKLAGQYRSLKDQLNPHFLFNSLNVLSRLVYENADKSAEFIQQLSKIYRYVLEIQQEELVSLQEEIKFARSYLSLQKIRFEESLLFEIDIQKDGDYFLPPLSLQLLLENAVKHNVTSLAHPLQISIIQEGTQLKVTNTYQPKQSRDSESTGIGLENIRKRYALLSDLSPRITQSETSFTVDLPLLQLTPMRPSETITATP